MWIVELYIHNLIMPTSRGSCRQVVVCGFCYGVTVRLDWVEVASAFVNSRFVLFFFFFFHAFQRVMQLLFMHCSLNNSRKCWLFHDKQWSMYCSRSHKLYFSKTFSLKMSPTILFTHLKIILLPYFQFSIFSFSKISSIQTDP